MFTCDVCLRRALLSLATISAFPPRLAPHSLKRTTSSTLTFARSHVTFESLRRGHHRHSLFSVLKNGKKKISVPIAKPSSARSKFNARQTEAVENNRLRRLEPEARENNMKRAMRLEAKYLVDPLKLAQAVVEKLRDNQLEEAMELVRASEKAHDGKGVENIVSWNHIIDWLMGQESPGEAWKVYNEMKKRGHKPDSHTYTIMLRGYRHNVKKPNAVQQAINVYDSMSAANSAVTPKTIHTNALLSVCARANDVDALWRVAGRLPERGAAAPDHVTFTTILQGLTSEVQRRAIEQGAREGPGFNPQPLFDQVIGDARKLWLDITARWRRGYLHVDEALVCAMGRLLMLSDDRETQKDVLNLVHQTMNIARMSEGSGDESRVDMQESEELDSDEPPPSTIDVPAKLTGRSDPTSRQISTVNTSVFATPGNNTLSMLIETATTLRELKLGKYYWELLTSREGPYKVTPDHQNIMSYMRLLRVSRASRAVLDLLREPRSKETTNKLMVRGTFIIAMSTCLRDKKNPNVFETASRVMDLMQESTDMTQPDDVGSSGQKLRFSAKVLRMYLEVAIATTKGLNGEPLEKTKNGDLDFERDPSKNHTLRALRRLGPDVFNVKQMIKSYLIDIEQQAAIRERTIKIKKLLEKRRITPYSTNENIGDLVELLRTMIGAYDKIILLNEKLEDDGMGPLDADILTECWLQKRKLSAYVSRYSNAVVEPRNPSDVRTRRKIDERGQRGPGRASVDYHDDADADPGEAATVEDFRDEEISDPSIAPPNPRSRLLSTIKSAQEMRTKRFEERGLSRRQKLELIKKEKIRAQFPASMLREKETSKLRDGTPIKRGRAYLDLARDQAGPNTPAWKVKQLENKLRKADKRESREREKEERKEVREKQTETYKGWGGGFEEMAREEGKDGNGFIDLRP